MDPHETDLIRQAQAGDTDAFDALVRMHDARILQVIVGILGNQQDAYDAYQETFIRAFTRLRSFRFESAFRTWLTRIAINQALNLRKKLRWKHRLSLDHLTKTRTPSYEPHPEQTFMDADVSAQVQRSLDRLSDRERTVFVLKHMHGYKLREIAEMLTCAEGTVKNYLFRATQKMRVALQPLYEDLQS